MTTGQRSEAMQYWAERWNVRRGFDPDIVAYRSPYLAYGHVPIQRQDVMCIDNYLQVRPLEWVVPARHNEYMGLGIFKPCTILSFDFNTDNILAPVLPMDPVNEASFIALRNSERSSNPTVGLFMGSRRPIATFTSTSSDRANRLYNKRDALKEPTKVFKAGPTRNQPMYAYDMPTWIRDLYTAGGQVAQLGGVMTDPVFFPPDERREQYQPEQQPEWAHIIGYLRQFGAIPPGPQIPKHPLVPKKKAAMTKKPSDAPKAVPPAKEAEDDVVEPPPVEDPLAAAAEEDEAQL